MSHGKKYVVISQQEYDMLRSKTESTIHNPEKRELHRAEAEMKNVLDREIPEDEKIRLFTEELNSLKSRYEKLTKPKPLKVVMEKNDDAPEKSYSLEDNIVKSLPKSSQAEGELLLNHLKNHPDVIKWNDRGEIIFKGDVIPGSNLTDLISNVTTMRKSSIPLLPQTVFLKALSETNTPESWIRNRTSKKLLQSYKSVKEQNPFTPPKKKKIDWSSFN